MDLDLRLKIAYISGLNLSGKSYFVKNAVIPNYRCVVFDKNKEYPADKCDVYYPRATSWPMIAREFDEFLLKVVKPNKGKYDLLIVDEADTVFPNNRPLMPVADGFKGNYRHDEWGNLGWVNICRRPAQIFTDLVSLAHVLFNFGNKGSQDISRLNAEASGLGDLVRTLANHEFAFVNQDRTYKRMPPI